MPTANSLNKPRAPMAMGRMGAVDPKKFRVETVVQKAKPTISASGTIKSSTGRASPMPVKKASSSPKPASGTQASTASSSHSLGNEAKRSSSGSTTVAKSLNGHAKHRELSRSVRRTSVKRGSPATHTPPTPMFDEDDDEGESDSDDLKATAAKRRKLNNGVAVDTARVIYDEEALKKTTVDISKMVQAADIAHEGATSNKSHGMTFTKYFTTEIEDGVALPHNVKFQYPSLCPRESYDLVSPKERDEFTPIDEMLRVMTTVSTYFLSNPSDSSFISDPTSGLLLLLRRSLKRDKLSDFLDLISKYNTFLHNLVTSGRIFNTLSSSHLTSPLPLPLVEQILTQTYSRTVSLSVSSLRQYENGTDNVYGELLPRFISNIFRETRLTSTQVFVDLGSGVGNVVLQAALEIGCESWGCEMMPNASSLADLQAHEFTSRCHLWSLRPGPIHLEAGDFLTNSPILATLRRADVILINNQAFTPSLNDKLIMHFLDLKEGCQIVSLKSFVPAGHKIMARNVDSPVNLLRDRELRYFSDSVSWTDAPGTYHIARKSRKGLEEFLKRADLG